MPLWRDVLLLPEKGEQFRGESVGQYILQLGKWMVWTTLWLTPAGEQWLCCSSSAGASGRYQEHAGLLKNVSTILRGIHIIYILKPLQKSALFQKTEREVGHFNLSDIPKSMKFQLEWHLIWVALLLLIRLFSFVVYKAQIHYRYDKPHGAAKNTRKRVKKLQYLGQSMLQHHLLKSNVPNFIFKTIFLHIWLRVFDSIG